MGEEDAAGQGDQDGGGQRGVAGGDQGHEGRDTPHAGQVHPAHEAAGEDDTGDGEGREQVRIFCAEICIVIVLLIVMQTVLSMMYDW